jgi:Flp pilus assembly protein TadG
MNRKVCLQKLLRLAREDHAQTLLEMALSLWTLILVLFGVLQCGLLLYSYHFTTYAAQQATNYAQVRGHTWSKNTSTPCSSSASGYDCEASATDIQTYVKSLATGGISTSNLSIDTLSTDIWPGKNADGTTTGCTTNTNAQGCLVQVKVTYTFNFLPYLKLTSMTITATSEKTIMQ